MGLLRMGKHVSKRSALSMAAAAAVVAALASCSEDDGDSGTAESTSFATPAAAEPFDLQAHRGAEVSTPKSHWQRSTKRCRSASAPSSWTSC